MKEEGRNGATKESDAVSRYVPRSRVKFIRVRANVEACWIPAVADTASTKRFRVYFEERSRTELIVHAASADEAKAHCGIVSQRRSAVARSVQDENERFRLDGRGFNRVVGMAGPPPRHRRPRLISNFWDNIGRS
jgi:hypothetical protein